MPLNTVQNQVLWGSLLRSSTQIFLWTVFQTSHISISLPDFLLFVNTALLLGVWESTNKMPELSLSYLLWFLNDDLDNIIIRRLFFSSLACSTPFTIFMVLFICRNVKFLSLYPRQSVCFNPFYPDEKNMKQAYKNFWWVEQLIA